jgi:hypothetical protein
MSLHVNQFLLFAPSALQELSPANGCLFLEHAVKQWISVSQLGRRSFVHCCGEASENEGEKIRMSEPLFKADTNLLLDHMSPFCSGFRRAIM